MIERYFKNCKYSSTELAARFMELSQKFLDYYLKNPNTLDFLSTSVKHDPECGTVACHGGFGLCILGGDAETLQTFSIKNNQTKILNSYRYGAELISVYLGFNSCFAEGISDWAKANPKIWGNKFGDKMFNTDGYKAFNAKDNTTTLLDIAQHYAFVAENLLVYSME